MKEIPTRHDYQNPDVQITHRKIASSGETFYDFSIPVVEKQTFLKKHSLHSFWAKYLLKQSKRFWDSYKSVYPRIS